MSLKGKNYLVIGATSGMGRSTAIKLYKEGAKVVIVARNEDKLLEMANGLGDRAYGYSFDMNNYKDLSSLFDFCRKNVGKLDGMFFSVGVCELAPIRVVDSARALEIIGLNCVSFLEAGKLFSMKKNSNDSSCIVGISSYESSLCDKGQSVYAGSKACMEAFARVMSKEFASRGIRVNTISPAIVDTDMLHRTQANGEYSYERIQEIQRFGVIDPDKVAELAVFLLTDANPFVTGENIRMSAGWIGEF